MEEAVAAAERFGFPVVMKILSPDILHKSEIGGVLLDVADAAGVRDGFALLMERAQDGGAGGADRGRAGGEATARVGWSASWASTATGVRADGDVRARRHFVEVLKDVVFRRCPFGADVAEAMIRSIKGAPLLLGARGRKPADVAALAEMLARLSVFAAQAGERLRSIDLNPVFAMPDGEGAFAADAVVEIG